MTTITGTAKREQGFATITVTGDIWED